MPGPWLWGLVADVPPLIPGFDLGPFRVCSLDNKLTLIVILRRVFNSLFFNKYHSTKSPSILIHHSLTLYGYNLIADPVAVYSKALQQTDLCNRGFESGWGHDCACVICVFCVGIDLSERMIVRSEESCRVCFSNCMCYIYLNSEAS